MPARLQLQATEPGATAHACGLTLSAHAGAVLTVQSVRERMLGQLADVLTSQLPVAVRVQLKGDALERSRQFERFCALLAVGLQAAGAPRDLLELTCAAADLAPARAWEARQRRLGPGVVNCLLDAQTLNNPVLLLELWRLRHENNLRVALSPAVSSACSLLASEPAQHVLPESGTQVPGETAWLMSSLDAANYLASDGTIALEAMCDEAVRLFDAAEECFEALRWPTAAMRQDAWLNRRIVVRLQGTGQLVAQAGLDPACLGTLRTVANMVVTLRSVLVQRSMQVARRAETLPAIAAGSPRYAGAQDDLQLAWQKRWIDAVRRSALRHRNLLVMSPWSLFPAASADFRYLNLLPLLTLADAHEFRRDLSIASWNYNKFNNFYMRCWAGLSAGESNYVVAERL